MVQSIPHSIQGLAVPINIFPTQPWHVTIVMNKNNYQVLSANYMHQLGLNKK